MATYSNFTSSRYASISLTVPSSFDAWASRGISISRTDDPDPFYLLNFSGISGSSTITSIKLHFKAKSTNGASPRIGACLGKKRSSDGHLQCWDSGYPFPNGTADASGTSYDYCRATCQNITTTDWADYYVTLDIPTMTSNYFSTYGINIVVGSGGGGTMTDRVYAKEFYLEINDGSSSGGSGGGSTTTYPTRASLSIGDNNNLILPATTTSGSNPTINDTNVLICSFTVDGSSIPLGNYTFTSTQSVATDPDGVLYNSSGTNLQSSTSGGQISLTHTFDTTGTYYLVIKSYSSGQQEVSININVTKNYEITPATRTLGVYSKTGITTVACNGNLGVGNYDIAPNSSVTVTATPSNGYQFSHWENYETGTTISTSNPYTFTMPNSDYYLVAVATSSSSSGSTEHTIYVGTNGPFTLPQRNSANNSTVPAFDQSGCLKFKFTPSTTATYTFAGSGTTNSDTEYSIFKSDGTLLDNSTAGRDEGPNSHFIFSRDLTGGATYYIMVGNWSSTYPASSGFYITVTKETTTTNTKTLTITNENSGIIGSITLNGNAITSGASYSIEVGSQVTLIANLNNGYEFSYWFRSSDNVIVSYNSTYSFTMPDSNLGLIARGQKITQEITIKPLIVGDNGPYTISNAAINSHDEFPPSFNGNFLKIPFTPTQNGIYKFTSSRGDGSNLDLEATVYDSNGVNQASVNAGNGRDVINNHFSFATDNTLYAGNTYYLVIATWGLNNTYDNIYINVKKENTNHTISFDANGGSGTMSNVSRPYGNIYTLPNIGFTAPTTTSTIYVNKYNGSSLLSYNPILTTTTYKSGNYWRLSNTSGTRYNVGSNYTVTSDVTFYAGWTLNATTPNKSFNTGKATRGDVYTNRYQVSFNTNGSPTALTSLSSQNKTVYNCVGWNTTSSTGTTINYNTNTTYSIVSQTNLYAIWNHNNTHLGITLPSIENKTGNTFNGWYNGSNKVGNAGDTYTPTANVTLKAGWKVNTFTMSFNSNGGSGTMSSLSKNYGSNFTLPNITYNAPVTTTVIYINRYNGNSLIDSNTRQTTITYTSNNCWRLSNTSGTRYNVGSNYTNNADATFYADWKIYSRGTNKSFNTGKATRGDVYTNRYQVSFNTNGSPTALTSLSSQNKTVYNCVGWNTTSSTGTTINYNTNTTYSIVSQTNLYAIWNHNNTHLGITLPSIENKTGNTFNGWYNGSNKVGNAGDTYTPTANVTLKAGWKVNTFTMSFNSNGGSGTMSSLSKNYGSNFTLPSSSFSAPNSVVNTIYIYRCYDNGTIINTPTRTTTKVYSFNNGWTLNSTSGPRYNVGTNYTNNANATFYAIWNSSTTVNSSVNLGTVTKNPTYQNKYKVSFNTNGGAVISNLYSKDKTTYNCIGWSKNNTTLNIDYNINTLQSFFTTTVLYAVWNNTITHEGIVLPSISKTGYIFKGWFTKQNHPTYTVSNIGTGFGFVNNTSTTGYYESANKKDLVTGTNYASSWALCQININAPQGGTMYLDCINSGEASCDFGILSGLNKTLSNNNSNDSGGNVHTKFNTSATNTTNIQTVTYTLQNSTNQFIQIKYRKDGSLDKGNDSLQFKIRFDSFAGNAGDIYLPSNNITLIASWEPQGLVRINTASGWQLAIPYIYTIDNRTTNAGSWKQTLGQIYNNDSWKIGI